MNLLTEENMVKLKLGLYGGLLFFSFFTIIAVPVSQNSAKMCILYSENDDPGPDSNCNYAVAMAVIFQLIYGIFRIGLLVMLMLGKLTTEFVLLSDMFQLIYTAVDVLAWFLVFISACILSAGINSTCSVSDCDHDSYGDNATRIHTAEAGAWISFVLWLVLIVSGVFMLFRQGKIPFLSRPAAGDGGAPGTTGTSPTMDTPPAASDEHKY